MTIGIQFLEHLLSFEFCLEHLIRIFLVSFGTFDYFFCFGVQNVCLAIFFYHENTIILLKIKLYLVTN